MPAPIIPKSLFSPKFYPHLLTDKRYNVFWGSRGSTKSEFCAQFFVLRSMRKEYMKLIYSRKDHAHIRESQFSLLKKWIDNFGLRQYFTIYEGSMKIVNNLTGNTMIAKGVNNPEKVKSTDEPSHIWCEELTEFDQVDFETLNNSIRTGKTKPQAFVTFNPIQQSHWVRSFFFDENAFEPHNYKPKAIFGDDILLHHSTFRDNPFINQDEYYKTLMISAGGDGNKLKVNAEGGWGQSQTGAEFYHAYNRSKHVKAVKFNSSLPVHLTFDFNVVPYMTMLCAQVDTTNGKTVFRFWKEYCLKNPDNSSRAVCKAFLNDYAKHKPILFYYGDASGKNRIAGQGNKRNFDDIEASLIGFLHSASDRVLKRNPNQFKARDFINLILSGYWPDIDIEIDESCTELIADMENVKVSVDGKLKENYNDKQLGISYQKHGHTSDAMTYFIVSVLYELYMSISSVD